MLGSLFPYTQIPGYGTSTNSLSTVREFISAFSRLLQEFINIQ